MTAAGHKTVLALLGLVALGALVVALRSGGDDGSAQAESVAAVGAAPSTTTTAVPASTTGPTTTAPATPSTTTTTIVPGAVRQFTMATGQSPVVGSGTPVTYTVEVEDAVGYRADELARIVDATLADPRSWIHDPGVAFQRVPSGGQVRIVLATPATTDQLCVPLNTAGIYSCHQGGTVAFNSDRWLHGSESWPGPIDEFRHYAVNHEIGHAIGHDHQNCGGAGQLAPIMMQQSKGLNGCLPNGWPYPFP